jgi:maleamate amidohydrolase
VSRAAAWRFIQLTISATTISRGLSMNRRDFHRITDDDSDANVFSRKVPGMLTLKEHSPASAIVSLLNPRGGELVVRKNVPSAFFGTTLAPWLTQRGVRTLVVAGCVTSGCVRASVVDAMCWGFSPVVVSDCVGDRAIGPHHASLFDMSQKYAEVMSFEALRPLIGKECL